MNEAADIQSAAVAMPLYIAGTRRPATKYSLSSTVRLRKPMQAYIITVAIRNTPPIQDRGSPRRSASAIAPIRAAKPQRNAA